MPPGDTQPAIIVTGGDPPEPAVLALLAEDAFVIAADSGLDHAFHLGLHVDLVVGDLDSVSTESLCAATDAHIPIEMHPATKDATDTELAIDAAIRRGHRELVGLTGGGGRLDHELTTLLAFSVADADVVSVWSGTTLIRVLRGPGRAVLERGLTGLLSLVPVHGDAIGVTTESLRYPLHDETLPAGTARGTSNEFADTHASVSLTSGTLLVIIPNAIEGTLKS